VFSPFIPIIQELLAIMITWDVGSRLTGCRWRGVVDFLEVVEIFGSRARRQAYPFTSISFGMVQFFWLVGRRQAYPLALEHPHANGSILAAIFARALLRSLI